MARLLLLAAGAAAADFLTVDGQTFHFKGHEVLLSGANVPWVQRVGRVEMLPAGPGFALSFKKTAPAVQRCKNQQRRCSYGRDWSASRVRPPRGYI